MGQQGTVTIRVEGSISSQARQLRSAATVLEGLERNDAVTYVPISEEVVDKMGTEWSAPVRVKAERREDGLVDLTFEELDLSSVASEATDDPELRTKIEELIEAKIGKKVSSAAPPSTE